MKIFRITLIFAAVAVTAQQPPTRGAAQRSEVTDTAALTDDIDRELAESNNSSAAQPQAAPAQGAVAVDRSSMPNILAAIDMVAEKDIKSSQSGDETSNSMFIRSAEFGFSGAIDWFANGQLLLAMHREAGDYRLDLHEAWFDFPNLPWNFYLKVGRMFPDAGRLNTIHLHDRVFTATPRVHQQLFDQVIGEGFIDNGGEISWLAPLPFFSEFKFGMFNGRTFGHAHNDGYTKPLPLLIGRQKNFFPIAQGFGVQWGFTYMHYSPTRDKGDADHKMGSDIMFKWQRGRWTSFEISGEVWYHKEERAAALPEDKIGFYIYIQWQPFERWRFGYRRDFFSRLNLVSPLNGAKYNGVDHGDALWVTYATSEFFNVKLTGERHQYDAVLGESYVVYVQGVFVLGFHPAHRF